MRLSIVGRVGVAVAVVSAAGAAVAGPCVQNAYVQVNLVANRAEFNPQIVDPLLLDGWGIAIRPPGAGGHFWINNTGSGTSTTYVGDVPGVPLFQDELLYVTVPNSYVFYPHPEVTSQPTGIVYTGHTSTEFMVTGEGITGPSKFIFVGLDGAISGWTTGQENSVITIDTSAEGSMFTGCAATELPTGNRLYVCDFNLEKISVYDGQWRPVDLGPKAFKDPRVPLNYSAFNMQYINGRIYVAFAHIGDDPGEEDRYPGYGYVSAFDVDGNLLQQFEHRLELNAPWGLAIAPADFGPLSDTLLVANFGDGTIIAYDLQTGAYIDYLRDPAGAPVFVDGIWGMLFGNGVVLGYTNQLYFAAGPNEEEDGIFGKFMPLAHAGDITCDGVIDTNDLNALLAGYGQSGPGVPGDLDQNGRVDFRDLNTLTRYFGVGR